MHLRILLNFCVTLIAQTIAANFLFAGSTQQTKPGDLLVTCNSEADNINVIMTVGNAKTKTILQYNCKSYTCLGYPEIDYGHKNKIPQIKINFDISGSCSPKLSAFLKRRVRSEMSFRHNLLNKNDTLLWLTYSKELPCKASQFKLPETFKNSNSQSNSNHQ